MPKSAPLKHQVRIIAGQYRRRLLPVVDAPESAGLRPTPDRVRQTVFNWLEHFLGNWDGIKAIDCFAGTGALGLEAASRGAASVMLCEQYLPAARQLQATVELLKATQCSVRQGDALAHLASILPASIDLIFLDPPFKVGWLSKLHAPAARALTAGGLVYAESEAALAWDGFEVLRHMKAGAVHAQLLRRTVI
jgi:16S rRNA (guanine(966)-N(2))-methyltransferase RsmD